MKSVRANVRKRKYVEHKEPRSQTKNTRSNSAAESEDHDSMSVEASEPKIDPDAKRRLFLGNLSPLTTEAQAVEFLSAVGTICLSLTAANSQETLSQIVFWRFIARRLSRMARRSRGRTLSPLRRWRLRRARSGQSPSWTASSSWASRSWLGYD